MQEDVEQMEKFGFEIYIQKVKPSEISWKKFISTVFDYDSRFTIDVEFLSNDVNLYLYSSKDLSGLAAKITPFILKPTQRAYVQPSKIGKSIGSYFFILPGDKNLLEIKEDQDLKGKVALKEVFWHFNSFLKVKSNTIEFLFEDRNGNMKISRKYRRGVPFYLVEQIDWSKIIKYKKKAIPVYLNIEDMIRLFVHGGQRGFLEVDGFPYLTEQSYLPLKSFDFDKHTLILGQTGVGKSKFIALFVRELEKLGVQDKYSVVVIDPHAAIFSDLNQVKDAVNLDFIKVYCDLFFKGADPNVATELTLLLFKTLLKDQYNSRLEQALKYSVFSLISVKDMSLSNLRRFLGEMEYRKKVLNKLQDNDNVLRFFDTDFIELQAKFYDAAIMPIIVLIDELGLLPVFKEGKPLEDLINNNFLTVFSLSRIFLGDRATKLIAGLLIQQMFLIAQSGKLRRKLILMIDEVPAVENEAMITVLSESRKFGVSLFLSVQFLDQITDALRTAVLSNVYNYFVFKTDEKDAKVLDKNLYLDMPAEVIEEASERGENKDDLKTRLFTSLGIRECLVRLYVDGKYHHVFKARTIDV